MKLKSIVSPRSGISYHRIVNPLSYWEPSEGWTRDMLWFREEEHLIDGSDVLLYNKAIFTDTSYLRKLQKDGMKIVVDVDDLWQLPLNHINYQAWKDQNHTQRIQEHIELADLVICSTMKLQNRVRGFNKNTAVIPNAFPFGYGEYIPKPVQHDKTAFMYMGGSTHLPDVKLLEGKFRRIGSDSYIKNHAEFVLAGYEPGYAKQYMTNNDQQEQNNNFHLKKIPGVWDKMKAVFSYTNSYSVLPSANLDEYLNYLDQADVALIPLQDTEWNSYKSILKVLEAAVKAVPVICSKIEPYYPELRNCPGIMWVEHADDWLTHIKWCIKNPIAVIDMGKQLMEYCKEYYDLITWNRTRKEVIESLI